MKKRNGFTLVELLAVIVVLGVIALIAVPISKNLIDNSKEKADNYSIELFLRAFKNEINAQRLNGNFNPSTCEVNDGIVICEGVQLNIDKSNISGTIFLEDREITYYDLSINDKYYSLGSTDERCFDYEVENNSIKIYDYYDNIDNDSSKTACPRDVIIPSTIDGKKVTVIGEQAFSESDITSLVIPNSVITIEEYAFEQLSQLNSKLSSVIIGNNVKRIESYAFCSNLLTSVKIPDSVTFIGYGAFYNNNLTNVTIPDSVTTIVDEAFRENQLTSVTIGDSVSWIGKNAFKDNQLTSLIIPDSVKYIGEFAFSDNQLTSLTLGTGLTSIWWGAFARNRLTSVVIPDNVSDINQGAFSENNLSEVIIGSGITYIGKNAFDDYKYTYQSSGRVYGPNQISSIKINASQSDVELGEGALSGVTGTVCWLKDNPTCGSN